MLIFESVKYLLVIKTSLQNQGYLMELFSSVWWAWVWKEASRCLTCTVENVCRSAQLFACHSSHLEPVPGPRFEAREGVARLFLHHFRVTVAPEVRADFEGVRERCSIDGRPPGERDVVLIKGADGNISRWQRHWPTFKRRKQNKNE